MKYTHEDGTPFTKEEFLQKLKTDKEFNNEFGNKGIDQISVLINELKTNPDSRRLMVSAWNVGELDQMVLPPCHYGFQVYTRELSQDERFRLYVKRDNPLYPLNVEDVDKYLTLIGIPTRAISLMWNQRSVDTFLGLPFNIASYGLLLEIIAKAVNMVPDELIGNLGDTHLYLNHIEQANEQIERKPFDLLPTLKHLRSDDKYTLLNEFPTLWSNFEISDFEIENYQYHPTIKAPLSN
jgi:thymidylate synthase